MLSTTIITLNEEKDLARCLKSVKAFSDEIIVVDSGSSDQTVEIAKRFGSMVFERRFDNYANQKNFALEKTRGDWIFSIDADEEVTPQLAEEIKGAVSTDKVQAYSIPRQNIIFGKLIKHTRWDPELDRHVWLWKKASGRWAGDVHEEVKVSGSVGALKNAKVHYQYETVSEFFDMINRYSELEASYKVKKGTKFNLLKLFFDPFYNFCVRFFYRKGFLDGWRGFMLSYLMAIYHLIVWVKIWQKQR